MWMIAILGPLGNQMKAAAIAQRVAAPVAKGK